MRRTVLALCVLMGLVVSSVSYPLFVNAQFAHQSTYYYPHHPECHTPKCAHTADQLWAKHQAAKRRRREARESREAAAHMSSLEACIIRNESSGNPQAVSGKYMGIGQWEESRWLSDGGGRFASTPLGASYAQQEIILRGEGEAGMIDQQGQYDGCA